jgi:hypothetical protein
MKREVTVNQIMSVAALIMLLLTSSNTEDAFAGFGPNPDGSHG